MGRGVQYLKIIAEQSGWDHASNRQLESVGKQLTAKYPECEVQLANNTKRRLQKRRPFVFTALPVLVSTPCLAG